MALKDVSRESPGKIGRTSIRTRNPTALERIAAEEADAIEFHAFVQFLFDCSGAP